MVRTIFTIFLLAIVVGCGRETLTTNVQPQTQMSSNLSCKYQDKVIADGDYFEKDSCNSCQCDRGFLKCTLMACE